MVATAPTLPAPSASPASAHRWWSYLGASVALNLLLATALGWSNPVSVPSVQTMLKINLVAHAAEPRRDMARREIARVDMERENMARDKMARVDIARKNMRAPSAASASAPSSRVLEEARTRRQVPPAYPRRALELGQQGLVVLHAALAHDGALRRVQVARSSGYPLLDGAAAAAVRQWEFEPPRQSGENIRWVRVPVRFVIEP